MKQNEKGLMLWFYCTLFDTIYKGKKGYYLLLSPNNNLFYLLSRSFMFNKRHFLFDHKVLRILLICFLPAGRHFLEPESEQLRIDLPSEMDSS